MKIFLTVVHVMTCFILIVVVLLQRGKGAEIGAVFGGGASSTVFGARGAGNFLTKLTTASAVIFMLSSLSLSYLSTQSLRPSLFEEAGAAPATGAAPGAPATDADSPFVEIEPPARADAEAAGEAATPDAPPTPAPAADDADATAN
ncbi:MAG: preprotein translocase subunit SecG [Deltaproteobacteria bacterium]|nr:MAG: preprotein translocase subunit SecG [Deltaproteobacteria bacterium]